MQWRQLSFPRVKVRKSTEFGCLGALSVEQAEDPSF